jgi:pyridoxal phosphate enzyme (YggS family)
MNSLADVAANLTAVKGRIAAAAKAGGRDPDAVHLIAVSKTVEGPRIEMALEAGQRLFGENRVQEAQAKFPALMERTADIELHLIGSLQTNKAKDAVKLCQVIHSLDRVRLVDAVADAMEKTGKRPRCFIQVNTGREPQKAGILPEAADDLIRHARETRGLLVVGLMCIPPADTDPAPHFDLLAEIARRHRLAQLSMGMSADYERAIGHGATHVRVGTAIFGQR